MLRLVSESGISHLIVRICLCVSFRSCVAFLILAELCKFFLHLPHNLIIWIQLKVFPGRALCIVRFVKDEVLTKSANYMS